MDKEMSPSGRKSAISSYIVLSLVFSAWVSTIGYLPFGGQESKMMSQMVSCDHIVMSGTAAAQHQAVPADSSASDCSNGCCDDVCSCPLSNYYVTMQPYENAVQVTAPPELMADKTFLSILLSPAKRPPIFT